MRMVTGRKEREMSAYVCNNQTISVIAKGFCEYGADFYDNSGKRIIEIFVNDMEQKIGQALLEQNVASVNYRYDEEEPAGKFEMHEDVPCDLGTLLGCINCYDYQACETPDYDKSWIYRSLVQLKDQAVRVYLKRQGMEMPWGID